MFIQILFQIVRNGLPVIQKLLQSVHSSDHSKGRQPHNRKGIDSILDSVLELLRITDTVINTSIDTDSDVILGDDDLFDQVLYFGPGVDPDDILGARVDGVESRFQSPNVLPEVFYQSYFGLVYLDVRVGAHAAHAWQPCSQETPEITTARHCAFITTVALRV